VTVHEDAHGAPRVVFVLNPTDVDAQVRVDLPGAERAADLLDGAAVHCRASTLELSAPARAVKMLRVA
jgi:beta-galactosidase